VKEREREIPGGIPLFHVAVADRFSRTIVDPGGALLRHREELRRRGDPRSLDQIPDDRMIEISVKNSPG